MQRERELNAVRHPPPTERACPLSKITQLTSGGHRISTQSLTPESVFSSTLPFHKTLLCFILKRLNFKTLRKVLVAHSCPTLWDSITDPWTAACQAPLPMEFSRLEYWRALSFPSPGNLPNPRIEPGYAALKADTWPLSHQGNPWRL